MKVLQDDLENQQQEKTESILERSQDHMEGGSQLIAKEDQSE